MPKLLYITANPKKAVHLSKGAQIGEVFLDAFQREQPEIEIERMHLYDMEIPEIDMDLLYARAKLSFMGYSPDQLSNDERERYTEMHRLADRFIAADYYVFVTPIWNLGAPAILKKFMDNLFLVNKTFITTSEGPKGLLTGRKAIHIQTRGGIYSAGPMAEFEMGDQYVRKALTFLGMELMDTIVAEGLDHYPEQVPAIMSRAKEQAGMAAREMAKIRATAAVNPK
ncbi:FMN-dependent NADH-azoreductase [Mesobacillus foraminis]|uniref:FMN dependent NADH:quinone oxidoreductase n=1 Tax=Mesobacillus foraminis TaxID=279826 RepID=A0A4R2BBQ1_9BACI|nr:NAD(P)H-dependent oxidoreductase [Mesobacillus foraminis]TCN22949.1 FMN-dependent NADH-azoreductase [Mesobacillus foraminis]